MTNQIELSFEFFPPRTQRGSENLVEVHKQLAQLKPQFVSVTFGAGGTNQSGTYQAVKSMIGAGSDAVPHISCVGASKEKIHSMIRDYLAMGVKRLVVLRGDVPKDSSVTIVERGAFHYANELVEFIRREFGDELFLEVAAYPDFHPESTSPNEEFEHFKRKVDAGADSALTQFFYNADSYFAFVEEARRYGVEIPIVPGIMPITDYARLIRFSDNCATDFPKWIRQRLVQFCDDEPSLKAFGLDVVTNLCNRLLENEVPGLHFYTLNRVEPVNQICKNIGFHRG